MLRIPAALLALTTALLLPAVAQADTRSVGIKSSGKTVKLDRGDTLRVKLRETPGTGYNWRVTKKPASSVLKLKSNVFKLDPQTPEGPSVGGPGTRTLTYRVKGEGTTSLTIKLFPPGRGTKADKKFTLNVRVG